MKEKLGNKEDAGLSSYEGVAATPKMIGVQETKSE